jgi:hypothetical protein
MKQLLVKLSDEEYQILEERGVDYNQLRRKVNRIDAGEGKLVSDLIREMRV